MTCLGLVKMVARVQSTDTGVTETVADCFSLLTLSAPKLGWWMHRRREKIITSIMKRRRASNVLLMRDLDEQLLW